MSDSDNDLIRMANQIAAFYGPYPHDEGLTGVQQHIKDFWEPRMRSQLIAHARAGGEGLTPVAREAVSLLAP